MQIFQVKLGLESLSCTRARPSDAGIIAALYRDVYAGDYPCPELFTEEGMREYLDSVHSGVHTVRISFDGTLVGVLSCQVNRARRFGYFRGGMLRPEYRGRIATRQLFQDLFQQFIIEFAPLVDYFYGENRTGNCAFHSILEQLGFYAFSVMPNKDIFFGERETECIHALYMKDPPPDSWQLTPLAARTASRVLGSPVAPVSLDRSDAISHIHKIPGISWQVDVSSKGTHTYLHVHGKLGSLNAEVCPASRNAEAIAIDADSPRAYATLVVELLREASRQKLEYLEILAPATNRHDQQILEMLGFWPTGFLPYWHVPGESRKQDAVMYVRNFPSDLPLRPPQYTPDSNYLWGLMPPLMVKVPPKQTERGLDVVDCPHAEVDNF